MNMDLRHSALLLLSGLMAAACGGEKKSEGTALPDSDAISMEQKVAGDSTLYGLACDGCTDSIVVILPNQGGDPDTFDIITLGSDSLELENNRGIFVYKRQTAQ